MKPLAAWDDQRNQCNYDIKLNLVMEGTRLVKNWYKTIWLWRVLRIEPNPSEPSYLVMGRGNLWVKEMTSYGLPTIDRQASSC